MRLTLLSLDGRKTVATFDVPLSGQKPPAAVAWGGRIFTRQAFAPKHSVFREVLAVSLQDDWRVRA